MTDRRFYEPTQLVTPMQTCLTDATIIRLFAADLAAQPDAGVLEHLESCAACRRRVEQMGDDLELRQLRDVSLADPTVTAIPPDLKTRVRSAARSSKDPAQIPAPEPPREATELLWSEFLRRLAAQPAAPAAGAGSAIGGRPLWQHAIAAGDWPLTQLARVMLAPVLVRAARPTEPGTNDLGGLLKLLLDTGPLYEDNLRVRIERAISELLDLLRDDTLREMALGALVGKSGDELRRKLGFSASSWRRKLRLIQQEWSPAPGG